MFPTIRYNGYKINKFPNDPSNDDPGSGIAIRPDIKSGHLFGGVDGKVANGEMVKKLQFVAILGPTVTEKLPPFDWSKSKSKQRHGGVTDKFDFKWHLFGKDVMKVEDSPEYNSFNK